MSFDGFKDNYIQANGVMAKNTELVCGSRPTVIHTWDNGKMESLKVKEFINATTVKNIKEALKIF